MLSLFQLSPHHTAQDFPPVEQAWDDPNGLLAIGGDLSVERLSKAYKQGIFPWFGPGEPIYWWSPDPRAVLYPDQIKISRSLRKTMRNRGYRIAFDQSFPEVVQACAAPRSYTRDTWITSEMYQAYCNLHAAGLAHSVEVYQDDVLVGGLYGVATGATFCGESMFSRQTDTSKMALVALAYYLRRWGYTVIDCQIANVHLTKMGASKIPRSDFLNILRAYPDPPRGATWQVDPSVDLSHWDPTALST